MYGWHPEGGGLEQNGSVESVLEEARTLCRVEHPNIVRFHSVAIDDSRSVAGVAVRTCGGTVRAAGLVSWPRQHAGSRTGGKHEA